MVLIQSADGTVEVDARAVIVATGAYVEPREHRPIAGGRPSGVITSDLAWEILRHGLRPGRVVALVGEGTLADDLASSIVDTGAQVFRLAEAPDSVRGEIRLEAVHAEEGWLEVDTLILADRLLAQAFVLRGLGLIDARPGVPAPADAEGRLPLAGLWAAGCSVNPSLDHRSCADQGRAVGRRAAYAMAGGREGPGNEPVVVQ